MKIDIAKTTDNEIQDIIGKLIKKEEYNQVDEAYLEVQTPFLINPNSRNESWKTKIGFVLYPELLSYCTRDEKRKTEWVTVPWICVKIEIEDSEYVTDESKQRELCKWAVAELTEAGYTPFHDEDAFAGYFKKDDRKGYVTFKMYINPDFPDGYWSNHTL